ncbi:MAG: hypothetical protein AAF433_04335 [Bacteroidota bacterium]
MNSPFPSTSPQEEVSNISTSFKVSSANWRRWPTHRIGETFYARGSIKNGEEQVQRAVCFGLVEKDFQELQKLQNWTELRIHLSCRKLPNKLTEVEQTPVFSPYLEAYPEKDQVFPLSWIPIEPPNNAPIARQTADLFCHEFCLLEQTAIGACFEAPIGPGFFRVNHFRFQQDEEKNNLKKAVSESSSLKLFLGVSAPIIGHPFRIRPILNFKVDLGGVFPPSSNGENCNFEFSQPCPPACG